MKPAVRDEISLREIIEIILGGKYILIAIVLGFMAIAISLNFLLSPVYQAKSLVRYNVIDNEETTATVDINSFVESMTSEVTKMRIMDKLGITQPVWTDIEIKPLPKSNTIEIYVKGENPAEVAKVSNLLAFEMSGRIEISDRSDIIVSTRKELLLLDEKIQIVRKELEAAANELKRTPEHLINKKIVAEEPLLMDMGYSGEEGLIIEEINPLHVNLSSTVSNRTIELEKLSAEYEVLKQRIEMNEEIIAEIETKIENEKIISTQSQRILTGYKALFITPSIIPDEPLFPNFILNIVLAVVIGFIFGLISVFIRYYWRLSSPKANFPGDSLSA